MIVTDAIVEILLKLCKLSSAAEWASSPGSAADCKPSEQRFCQ